MLRSNSLSKRRQRALSVIRRSVTMAPQPQVGSLYVRKSAMPGGKIPKVLTVTIKGE